MGWAVLIVKGLSSASPILPSGHVSDAENNDTAVTARLVEEEIRVGPGRHYAHSRKVRDTPDFGVTRHQARQLLNPRCKAPGGGDIASFEERDCLAIWARARVL
jgi:hypothetical protein